MSDLSNETPEAQEAEVMGEKPDLGRKTDALSQSLTGSDTGSDTRAGSLEGGAASGSDEDPDQDAVNEVMASEGMSSGDTQSPEKADPQPVNNTGPHDLTGPAGDPVEGKDADAATG